MAALGEILLQAVRGSCRQAFGLTDAQVIPADSRGPRPPLPYLSVRVGTLNIPEHAALEELQVPLSRVTVADGAEDDTVTLTVDGVDYAHTWSADDTAETVAASLAAAIWADHASDDHTVAAADGADVLLHPGVGRTVAVTVSAGLALLEDENAEVFRGGYSAAITVQGHGAGADVWVEGLEAALRRSDVETVADAAGVDLRRDGGIVNVAALLDTAFEPRWSCELSAAYTAIVVGGTDAAPVVVPLVALATVEAAYTQLRRAGDASPVTADLIPLEAS